MPNGELVAIMVAQADLSSLTCSTKTATGSSDRFEGKNFKASTVELHHDTLIDYSAFEKKERLTFLSFDSNGRASEVEKSLQAPGGFELSYIICISTAAVAAVFRQQIQDFDTNSFILRVLDFT